MLGLDRKESLRGSTPYRSDPKASPPTIDLWYGPEAKPERAHLGIFRLDGDTLTLCSAPPGTVRPTKFASPAGAELSLVTLRRSKAKD
jgi:uncharacterized protein (TIGR03067 family)